MTTPGDVSLRGCRAAVTREHVGELGRLLASRGAVVEHVPLIEVADPDDGGAALRSALADPTRVDWVFVTSPAGADRVAPLIARHDETEDRRVRVACVGAATAARVEELTGRRADLVPGQQRAAALAAAFVDRAGESSQRVVLALADLAAGDLAEALRRAGHRVTSVVAYHTRARTVSSEEVARLRTADAVLFASGSAAAAWSAAMGADALSSLPPIVVSIGPSTTANAQREGLKVTCEAADHSVPGMVAALESAWRERHGARDVPDSRGMIPPDT